jgi:DNA-binding NarL/FixJ family response regulator
LGLSFRIKENPAEKLSSREYEIFKLLADGNGNLEIANKLNIQMSTVSTYKKRIFQKLDVANIAELIKVYEMMH